jgi:hypothetical protein
MTDPRDEINRIIESATREAYARGWRDAVAAIAESAAQLKGAAPENMGGNSERGKPLPRRTGRPSTAIKVVEECIAATPGMKGVDVVKAAQSVDSAIKERTVRSCLRRLRLTKAIWKRNGLWYPKAKDREPFDGVTAEAA